MSENAHDIPGFTGKFTENKKKLIKTDHTI